MNVFATEVWLTRLLLLPGVALLIMSTASRFGQVQMEFHRLLDHSDSHALIVSRGLIRRSAFYRNALVSLYASVALFAAASLLGGFVNLWRPNLLWVVGAVTIAGIGCIVWAAAQLLRESLLSLQVIQDQANQIQEALG